MTCENVVERRTTHVRDVTVMMADRGLDVFCTAPPDIGRFDEEQIEDEKGVTLLTELVQLMRRVLAAGAYASLSSDILSCDPRCRWRFSTASGTTARWTGTAVENLFIRFGRPDFHFDGGLGRHPAAVQRRTGMWPRWPAPRSGWACPS